jgi:hypothetical protein
MSTDEKHPAAPEDDLLSVAEGGDQADDRADDAAELNLDARILCSDGTCIGVIGPDGRCKECGKPYVAADDPDAVRVPAATVADDDPAGDPGDDDSGDHAIDEGEAIHLDDRVLCSDGSCIGVIGPDGRCKECGKPREGPAD